MLGMTRPARIAAVPARKLGLALTIVALLAICAPAASNASGCTDSWTNAAGGSWFTPGNWSTKAVPSSTDEACITLAGTYTVEMAQTSPVSVKTLTVGGASGTQALVVSSTPSANAVLATSSGLTSTAHGAVTLTSGETNANNVTLEGPVTNGGTLSVEKALGGGRALTGSITNSGTLAVNANTAFNGASAVLSNAGALNLATGVQLVASNSSTVTDAGGGKITGAGTGDVLIEPGSVYNQGAGTTTGTKPVIVRDATVNYTGAGSSLVTVHGESSAMSGNISAGQTLVLESTGGENVRESASASFANAGTITLTNGEGNSNNVALTLSAGTLSSSGSINVEKANGGGRAIQGSITNTGTIAINGATSYNGAKALLANQGALNIAGGAALVVSNEGAVANGAGGTLAATGSGVVAIEPGSAFTEGAGTTSGTKPVVVRDAALHYTGSGASSIAAVGESVTVTGNIAAGQSLTIESTGGENSRVTASASFSNAGTITLTNAPGNANNASLTIGTEATLSNSGSLVVEKGLGGGRTILGAITNTGTLAINSTTAYAGGPKALLTNGGALSLAAGSSLTVSGEAAVINGSGGSVSAGAGAAVNMEPGTFFTQGAGTTSGPKPVIVRDATLTYTGAGASSITARGEGTVLSGNIAAGQSLTIESTSGEHARATAAASFTNAGAIILTNGEGNSNNASLTVSAGTLTNSGTITAEKASGGARAIQGNLTNTGTLAINANTAFNASEKTLLNEGAINVATGVAFAVSANSTVTNAAGLIAATGTGALVESTGTFNQGLGKTSTAKTSEPVILVRVTLHYTGAGASKISLRGASALSGAIGKGQTLSLQSTCNEHAEVSAAGAFVNSGTLNMTNGDVCANNVRLSLAGATLENKGTINVLFPHGGGRLIEGSLTNEKTLAIGNDPSQSLKVTGSFSQGAKATLKDTIAGSTNFSRLTLGGAAALSGKLSLKQVKFTGKLGESFAILSSASRTGTFASITGNLIKGGAHYIPQYTPTGVNLLVE